MTWEGLPYPAIPFRVLLSLPPAVNLGRREFITMGSEFPHFCLAGRVPLSKCYCRLPLGEEAWLPLRWGQGAHLWAARATCSPQPWVGARAVGSLVLGRPATEEAGDTGVATGFLPTVPEGKGWPGWTRLVLLPGASHALLTWRGPCGLNGAVWLACLLEGFVGLPALCMIYLRGNEAAPEGGVPWAWGLSHLRAADWVVLCVCVCVEGVVVGRVPACSSISGVIPSERAIWMLLRCVRTAPGVLGRDCQAWLEEQHRGCFCIFSLYCKDACSLVKKEKELQTVSHPPHFSPSVTPWGWLTSVNHLGCILVDIYCQT